MTATFTKVFQILATVLQVLNAINISQLPPKWQAAATGFMTCAQAIQGVLAHYQTPAGQTIEGDTGKVKDTTGATVATVPTVK